MKKVVLKIPTSSNIDYGKHDRMVFQEKRKQKHLSTSKLQQQKTRTEIKIESEQTGWMVQDPLHHPILIQDPLHYLILSNPNSHIHCADSCRAIEASDDVGLFIQRGNSTATATLWQRFHCNNLLVVLLLILFFSLFALHISQSSFGNLRNFLNSLLSIFSLFSAHDYSTTHDYCNTDYYYWLQDTHEQGLKSQFLPSVCGPLFPT